MKGGAATLREKLLVCCGCGAWADGMVSRAPYASSEACLAAARDVWGGLGRAEWLEAFAAQPQIGDMDALRAKYSKTAFGKLSGHEQRGVEAASEATLVALSKGNKAYLERFGHIFIVCATGKTAAEMLALLDARMDNDPAAELLIAAGEQEKITEIRLRALLANEARPNGLL